MSDSTTHPYTSVRITTNTGPLAQIWLAANMSNLPRNSILQTSIVESADEIAKVSGCDNGSSSADNLEHITLHTSGDLLQGIVRVYSKQAVFLLNDIKDTLTRISSLFKTNQRINVTLSKTNTIARVDQLILEDAVTEREVLVAPDLNFLFETPSSKEKKRLMTNDNSMERRVQGAAPWDTSLEVGRRFNPDEELEYHQSSALDLDFDIDNVNTVSSSKTWEEGTRQTVQDSRNGSQNRESNEPENFIADDDFPLEDPNGDDWNLGISENDEHRKFHDDESDMSVEIGRRVGENSNNDVIDFGFDLDIEKEVPDQQTENSTETVRQSAINAASVSNQKDKGTKDSTLINARKIGIDNETELNDEEIKGARMIRTVCIESSSSAESTRMNKKRLLEDFTESMGHLPTAILDTLFSRQSLKRSKMLPRQEAEQPELDISLGIDEDLLQSSIINSSRIGSDADDSDHFVPIDADIGQPPIDEDSEASIATRRNTAEESDADQMQTQQTQRLRLITGELASKSVVHMAELLRTEFIDNDAITFQDVLKAKHKAQEAEGESETNISKGEASKGFFEMLSLATAGCIDLDQRSPFENISITNRAPLYEKFITA